MGIVQDLKGMISKRQTLAGLDLRELQKAQAQGRQEQDRLMAQLDEIEKKKSTLDAQGRAERSARKQELLARQILDLEAQAKYLGRGLDLVSRQMRIVNGFVFLKENSGSLAGTQVGQLIGKMDTAELQAFVDQATVDGAFQMDKLNDLLGVMEDADKLEGETEGDKEVDAIVAQWQGAQADAGLVGERE